MTLGEQVMGWSVLLGSLLLALSVGAWREERRRAEEDRERRRKVMEEYGDEP